MATTSKRENDAQPASGHPSCTGEEEVCQIFLSHSGKQKPFVENLFIALRNANRSAFFDQITLPKGSAFPPSIKQAARGCKLGVVVLSEDFFTSKWPMVELEMLVLERGSDANVLPLFYKLRPEDLKCTNNLSRWRRKWKGIASSRQQAEKWEEAVRELKVMNGEIFVKESSEAAYIERVVRSVCKSVASDSSYDLSNVQGRQRLVEEVARRFEHVDARQICDQKAACMVGLHGEGGSGKTTLCQIMVNFYDTHDYPGRSHLLEFPTSDGDDKRELKIVEGCKAALRKLTNLSHEHALKEIHSLDQVVQVMKKKLKQYDVFLAIDNVWQSSYEEAEKILGISFSAGSKILVTSRSEQVLKDLLNVGLGETNNTIVSPLPAPEHEEALQIFQEAFRIVDLNSLSLEGRDELHCLLESFCKCSGTYHALALKALGQHVRKVCTLGGLEEIEHHLSIIRREIRNSDLPTLDKVIRLSYDDLEPEHKKHMFLDIAVLPMKKLAALTRDGDVWSDQLTYEKAHQWLNFLYKGIPENQIVSLIYDLALDGLIHLETVSLDGRAEKVIRVHDLYSDLAQREAAKSCRFFLEKSQVRPVKEIEWEKLERVVLENNNKHPHFIETLLMQKCQKLQVLSVGGRKFGSVIAELHSGLDLDRLSSLCVLKLEGVTLRSIQNWSAATGLGIVHLHDLECGKPLEPIPSMPCLEELAISCNNGLFNIDMTGPPNIQGCQHLKELVLDDMSSLFGGIVLECNYFNCLTNLERLRIQYLNRTTRDALNLKTLVRLQELGVGYCDFLERIEGLDALKNVRQLRVQSCRCLKYLDGLSGSLLQLEFLKVEECASIKKLLDLSGLTRLESLYLQRNESMEEIVGGLSSTLKDVQVYDCGALKKMPDLSGLTRLESLDLRGNESMEEIVGGLSSILKAVHVYNYGALKKMPDLSGLTRLESLDLRGNESMEEIVGGLSSTLKDVQVYNCGALKKMPDLSGLTRLESLDLRENESMEEIVGGLSSTLKDVQVYDCGALKKIPDLSGLTRLEGLVLERNESMEEIVGGLSSTLKVLSVIDCGALKKMPDLSGLTRLESLYLRGNESMEEIVGGLSSTLKDVVVYECGALKKMPDLSGLTRLESLDLRGNKSMEKIVGGLSSTLKDVVVYECGALRKMPDLSGLTRLESLHLRGNESMEEIVGGLSSTLKVLQVIDCGALKKMPDLSGLTGLESLDLQGIVGGLRSTLKVASHRLWEALKRLPAVSAERSDSPRGVEFGGECINGEVSI